MSSMNINFQLRMKKNCSVILFLLLTIAIKAQSYNALVISISVHQDSSQLIFDWKTDGESNTSFFIVDRSTDSLNWVTRDTALAAGNSSVVLSYSYTDTGIFTNNQKYYYRLKVVYSNNTYAFFNVVYLTYIYLGITEKDINEYFKIIPNPCVNFSIIKLNEENNEKLSAHIFNSQGTMVKEIISLADNYILNRVDFSPGLYFIELIQDKKRIGVCKILIN